MSTPSEGSTAEFTIDLFKDHVYEMSCSGTGDNGIWYEPTVGAGITEGYLITNDGRASVNLTPTEDTTIRVWRGDIELQIEDLTNKSVQNAPSEYVSVGVGLGEELVENGTFDTDVTGWSPHNAATLSVSSNRLKVESPSDYDSANQTINTVKNGVYIISFDVVAGTANGRIYLGTSSSRGSYRNTGSLTTGSYSYAHTITDDLDLVVGLAVDSATSNNCYFDNVSVKAAEHGLFVDGIKAFATSAHNNSVDANGVVTEGTASGDISDDIYYLAEPSATNYSDGDDDLSGGAEVIDLTAAGTGDYTLSLMGTAAVTVAAGTATGTGFGQATEGSPVTFNLSAAGTITLTLNSGALDKSGGLAIKQVEKSNVASSWIPTSGGSATRTADLVKYDIAGNHNQDAGTVVFDWETSLAQASQVATDQGLVTTSDSATGLAYHDSGGVRTTDGTTVVTEDPTYLADNLYRVAVRWGSSTFQVGIKDIDGAGSWAWATAAAYDGAFAFGSFMNLFYSALYPQKMKDLNHYQTDKGTDWIEANY